MSEHDHPDEPIYLAPRIRIIADYDTDFVAWAEEQASLLREGRFEALDVDNVIEELEGLARRYRECALRHLRNLCEELLKLAYGEPGNAGRYGHRGLEKHRLEMRYLLEDYPSLSAALPELLQRAYARGRLDAEQDLQDFHYQYEPFPDTCPWSLEQVLDLAFLPPPFASARR
jgi:hypothetical protein